jgi:HJR/Mrr/RecB family endonuclease
MPASQISPDSDVKALVDQLIAERRLTYQQYQQFSHLVLADGVIDDQERRQINRLFDAIQMGVVKILI